MFAIAIVAAEPAFFDLEVVSTGTRKVLGKGTSQGIRVSKNVLSHVHHFLKTNDNKRWLSTKNHPTRPCKFARTPKNPTGNPTLPPAKFGSVHLGTLTGELNIDLIKTQNYALERYGKAIIDFPNCRCTRSLSARRFPS